jgi:spermidine synthase
MTSIVISEERGVRYLHFGSPWVQGAMRLSRPHALELEYTREMMLPLLLHPDEAWPASVLQIGLGAGSITRWLLRHRPEARLTVLEVAPDVVAAARAYFHLAEESPLLRIVIGDGFEFVMRKGRFDFIVVDGFDHKGRTGMLDTQAFYMNCLERLTARGALSVNMLSRSRGVGASVKRMQAAFGERVLALPPSEPGNMIVLAAAGDPLATTIGELRASATVLKSATGLDLASTLARLAAARGSRIAL